MKLNTNSWHCKLYCILHGLRPSTWTYEHALPKNGCKYFKSLILCIFAAPFFLPFFWLGGWISDRENKGDKGRKYIYKDNMEIWCTGLLYTTAACMIISMIWFPFIPFNAKSYYFLYAIIIVLGGLGYICLATLIILFIRANYLEWRDARKLKRGIPDKPKEPSIFKEIIKAWYQKYCPKLEWVDGTKTHKDEE